MEGFFGCCGRYKVDTKNHVIYHYPKVALDPELRGDRAKAPIQILGDGLTFSDKDTTAGVESFAIT